MEQIISIDGLCKSFGDVKAVQNLSFQVKKGELFAFLGVNGAGKSTTISILCGQLAKDAGTVFVCGEDVEKGISRNGGDEQQVEDDDDVRDIAEHCKRREAADGDEQLDDYQRREADYRGGEEGSLGGRGGDYRLLAAELEEIIERLKHRRADALLHPRDELAVDAAEQQSRNEAEQEAGENQDIAEILEIIQNHTHNSHLLKVLSA